MNPRDPGRNGSDDDAALGAEVVDQLHHRDDRREAAEMRIEELVRDTEYDEEAETGPADREAGGEPHLLAQPSVRNVWLWAAAAVLAAILYALTRLLPT